MRDYPVLICIPAGEHRQAVTAFLGVQARAAACKVVAQPAGVVFREAHMKNSSRYTLVRYYEHRHMHAK
jgi:hypothetical protein